MNEKYEKIINLPHHVSKTRTPMLKEDRAAQFAPYSALSGYEDAVEETARLTDKKHELDDYEKEKINAALTDLLNFDEDKTATITFFLPDKRKKGGSYITTTGQIGSFDEIKREITMTTGRIIKIDDIMKISIIAIAKKTDLF